MRSVAVLRELRAGGPLRCVRSSNQVSQWGPRQPRTPPVRLGGVWITNSTHVEPASWVLDILLKARTVAV
jgi:hypothetical protein